MFKIIFKNVGQGDTIILEWGTKKNIKVGFIDCYSKNPAFNPIIEYLKKNKISEIKFIILSHPHTDHFYGLIEVLDYCEKKNIYIEYFIHTAHYHTDFLNAQLRNRINLNHFAESFLYLNSDQNYLKKLYKKIVEFHDKSILELFVADNLSEIPISKNISLKFLSPSTMGEIRKYFKNTFELGPDNKVTAKVSSERENNINANLFSSVIQISSNKWHVLLTSDATKYSFRRIIKNKHFIKLSNSKLNICQIPHHGSVTNHDSSFWLSIIAQNTTSSFISVGDRYGHPDCSVIEFFANKTKQIHSTNYVGGFKDYFNNLIAGNDLEKSKHYNLILDSISTSPVLSENTSIECGEKQIVINTDGSYQVFTSK